MMKASVLTAAATALPWGDRHAAHAAPASAPATGSDRFRGLKVGVATYTFRQRPLAPTIDGIRRVGLAYCSIKDFHLPLKSTPEQRREVADQFRAAGITPLSCGNITMRTDADARQAFEYARDAGIPTIVCAPVHDVLPALDKLVREFDIRVAIHNHGPEDKWFPSPYDVWDRVKDLDRRVGLCIDVGHAARSGAEPAGAIRKCRDRVYDIHMKDLANLQGRGKAIEVGRGLLDVKGMLQALLDIKFDGHVGFEHEKDFDEPLPGLAESVGYVRGVIAALPV
jgi:sugar phosphate isomerase/epimerase